MAAVIKVLRVVPASPGRALELQPTVIPVARIDFAETAVVSEYLENEFTPIARSATRIVKVNGEHIIVNEPLDVVESLIAHAGRN